MRWHGISWCVILQLIPSTSSNLSLSPCFCVCDRTALSQALVTSSKVQDPSATQLKTLIISLLSAFSASEVTTLQSNTIHSKALQSITLLTSQGLLGDSEYSSLLLAQLVSAFTVPSNGSSLYSTTKKTQYPIDTAVSDTPSLHMCHHLSSYIEIFLTLFLTSLAMSIMLIGEELSSWSTVRNGWRGGPHGAACQELAAGHHKLPCKQHR